MKDYDFSGWATKNDILCEDGRTIKRDAFKDCDGIEVPLVYNHDHKDIKNVLGHAILENRPEGVYCYGYFDKDTDQGNDAFNLVKHGHLKSLSIYANKLKQMGKNVVHGLIREVSLVIAGANSGAVIDNVMAHAEDAGDINGDALIIYAGDENPIYLEHAATDEDDDDFNLEDEVESMTPNQKRAMLMMMGMAAEDAEQRMSHSADSENEEDSSSENDIESENDGETSEYEEDPEMDEAMEHSLLSCIFDYESELSHSTEDDDNEDPDDDENYEDDQNDDSSDNNTNEEENEEMTHNIFENGAATNELYHSAELCGAIMDDAVKYGSLKDSVMAHSNEYGIENIDYLFPNAKNYTTKPEFIMRRTEWVNAVMNGVGKSPFARVKTIFADITEDEARARGYIKGNRKAEEVFTLLKRETTPTTVYKKQKIDRDDITDITDFSVIELIKEEMRILFDEECARAILVGDGRNPLNPEKIKEQNVRPIWTDDDLFTVKRTIAVSTATTDDAKAKALIKNIIKSRKLYRGSGAPTLFISEDLLSDMLLIEDTTGRLIYDDISKLKNVLRVKEIVEVPIFAGLNRIDNGDTKYLGAILVNLNDYRVGRDKGGEMNFFDDFDIDFNQYKYLMEARFSGALVVPYSAIAYEFVYNLTVDMQAKESSATILGKQVSDLQENVYVNDTFVNGVLNYVTGFTAFDQSHEEYQEGHYLALQFEASDGAVTKIQTVGGIDDTVWKTLDTDMDAVIYVKSNKMKLRVKCELNGDVINKTYSFGGLKLLQQ